MRSQLDQLLTCIPDSALCHGRMQATAVTVPAAMETGSTTTTILHHLAPLGHRDNLAHPGNLAHQASLGPTEM